MTDRLTSTKHSSLSHWTVLALPAALLLVVLRESWTEASYLTRGGHLGLWALFCLQIAAIVRDMLPPKAPVMHKTLAACLGVLTASWLIREQITTPGIPWILALAAWNFFHGFEDRSIPPKILSGLCAGTAISLAPVTLILSLPLLVQNQMRNRIRDNGIRIAAAQWELGILLGLIPLIVGKVSLPVVAFDPGRLSRILEAWETTRSTLPWAIWPFLLLGAGVSIFQAKKIFWGLLLPLLIVHPVALCLFSQEALRPVWLFALTIWTAYGVYRVIKGVEQGMRKTNPAVANKVMGISLFQILIAYAVWTGFYIYPLF